MQNFIVIRPLAAKIQLSPIRVNVCQKQDRSAAAPPEKLRTLKMFLGPSIVNFKCAYNGAGIFCGNSKVLQSPSSRSNAGIQRLSLVSRASFPLGCNGILEDGVFA